MNTKKRFIIAWVVLVLSLSLNAVAQSPKFHEWAPTPPMGWNSWDCYGAGVWQADVLANADYMAENLKAHGWDIITIDIQWYEPLAHTTEYRRGAILETDENGRVRPAPNRFPMTKETRSFKPIADYLHAKGLKFGLHMMRGVPRQSVDRDNCPILGTDYRVADIADKKNVCPWNGDMYGVDMTKPGAQEYYDSVFALLASWDLDFVKVDDISGRLPEVEAVRKAIDNCGRPIILSLSPGGTSPENGAHDVANANMWRISNDFWDNWGNLYSQFARLNNWTPHRGPGHWPDADMLPLGNIQAWKPNSWTHFTQDEQYTLITLWCIGRSPLMFGGNMPKNDAFTLELMTNDEVIAVNQNSANNRQVFAINNNKQFCWVADVPGSRDKYVALFNAAPVPPPRKGWWVTEESKKAEKAFVVNPADKQPAKVSVLLADLGLDGSCKVRDLWAHKDLGTVNDKVSATINSHGAVLYRVQPEQ